MKRTLVHPTTKAFWSITLDDETLTLRTGPTGTAGEETVIEDAYEERSMPADVLFDELVEEQRARGFVETLPDDLLEQIESGHGVALTGRLRELYTERAYAAHQHAFAGRLECRVDFTTSAVLGAFAQEYDRPLVPIAGRLFGSSDRPDEQQWIGVDASLGDGPVFELYTSGSYEEAYPNLDAFLADLRPASAAHPREPKASATKKAASPTKKATAAKKAASPKRKTTATKKAASPKRKTTAAKKAASPKKKAVRGR